jgi:hypothetical protein
MAAAARLNCLNPFGCVRPFREDDIPEVADIHRRVWNLAERLSPQLLDSYQAWFSGVFLNSPWQDDALSSLVYEDGGRITGFLGVLPQRLSFKGESVRLAVVSNFVIDPHSRGLAGMKLLSALLAGPQDLAVADEANEGARRLWEGLGGITSLPYSMHWYYPLRPCRFALRIVETKRLIPRLVSRSMTPLAAALDSAATRILKARFRGAPPRVIGEELSHEMLLACLAEVAGKHCLRPDHDARSLSWLLQRADQMRRNGSLRKILVKTETHDIAGWYLYYLNPGGVSQVIQLHAKPNFADDVLDHLLHDAWQQGATALGGRPEPSRPLMQVFSNKRCIFQCGPEWMLVHSRRPELLHAFHKGDVYFSRLEGEWCTHFR